MTDILEMHERALDQTIPLVEAVRSDQLDLPTPCTQWNVRALLNHMVAGNRMFSGVAEGLSAQQARPAGDVLGDDPAGAYRQSAEALKAAWRVPGRLAGTYTLPVGTLPGPAAMSVRLTETVVHGWDLARATGQTPSYDDDLVQAATQFSHANLARERPQGGPFAPAVDCPDDAPAVDRLAAFMGRQP